VLKGRDDDRLQPLLATLQQYGVSIQYVQRKTLDDKAEGAIHQGIIAKVKEGRKYDESDLDKILEKEQTPFFLVLDGVTDPHNLGACLRTADAAGVHALIVPRDKSVSLTGTARKVACGAAESAFALLSHQKVTKRLPYR
jgi:23S rRNA (guanosine2251-2'-O)-methyltransferase